MNRNSIEKISRIFITFIIGIIEIILIIRFPLKLIGASTKSSFVQLLYSLSDPIYAQFAGTLEDIQAGNLVVEINIVFAILFYFIIGYVIYKILDIIFSPNIGVKLKSLSEAFFKTIEMILGMRFVLKMLSANRSEFVTLIYSISSIIYQPFAGILDDLHINDYTIELSTLIAIIIIVGIDFLTDRLFIEMIKNNKTTPSQPQTPRNNNNQPPQPPQNPQSQINPNPQPTAYNNQPQNSNVGSNINQAQQSPLQQPAINNTSNQQPQLQNVQTQQASQTQSQSQTVQNSNPTTTPQPNQSQPQPQTSNQSPQNTQTQSHTQETIEITRPQT